MAEDGSDEIGFGETLITGSRNVTGIWRRRWWFLC